MINKDEVIRFAEAINEDAATAVVMLVATDKKVSPYVEGNTQDMLCAIITLAKNDKDFSEIITNAVDYLNQEGGDE